MPPTVRHRAPDAVHLWMTGSLLKLYGGLSPVGEVVVTPVAVASPHGRGGPMGTAAACQLVGIRQRAGAGGWRLGYGPVCFYAGGQGPAARRVRPWGMGWCCCPSCRGRGGADSAERCWSSSWPAGWPVPPPCPAAVLPGPGHLGGGLYRWPPTAASGSQWPAWRSPARHSGRFRVPFRWRSGRWAGQAVPQARSSMVRDGRGGNRWRATRAPGQHGARLAE